MLFAGARRTAYKLRKGMWRRYRYWYLFEDNVDYDEGQSTLLTCCWKLNADQLYDINGSPEL